MRPERTIDLEQKAQRRVFQVAIGRLGKRGPGQCGLADLTRAQNQDGGELLRQLAQPVFGKTFPHGVQNRNRSSKMQAARLAGFDPFHPSEFGLSALPASYHNGAGSLNFADGHAEIHLWRDPRTKPPLSKTSRPID